MASTQISKVFYHARSISLPSENHPIVDQFDEQLCRLRSSQSASTSSLSSSITDNLTGLTDLYCIVDELLQLPSNQQALVSKIQSSLDGSLRLLDVCGTSRDILVQSKERLQDIQSVLRRRCSGELNITKEVSEYLNTRKNVKKAIKNCLKCIRIVENEETECLLNDVEKITVDIFTSLLSYIGGGSKSQSRKSFVTKLFHKNSDKVIGVVSEFDGVDSTLESLVCQKKNGVNMSQIEIIKNQMAKLESEIQVLDEVLECLFRRFVNTRANLLNILSN